MSGNPTRCAEFASLDKIKEYFIYGTPTEVIAIESTDAFQCCTVLYTDHDDCPMMEVRVHYVRANKTYTARHSTTFYVPELVATAPYLFYYSMQACILGTERSVGEKVNTSLRTLLEIGKIDIPK